MSNHPPHAKDQKKPADETPRPPTSDEQLKGFWLKNEKKIYVACFIVIVVVAAAGIFRNMQKESANKVGVEYAEATTPEKLRAFIAAHPGHILSAAAELRIADDAYRAKNYAEAAASYDKAAAVKNTPFAGRALIGAAMSKILSGQNDDGEARLGKISNDATQAPVVRGEATYHLATIAADAGRTSDAVKFYEQVGVIAPGTVWAENAADQTRRLSVATNTSATAQPAAAPVPTVQFQ